jgi:hypothetical protein
VLEPGAGSVVGATHQDAIGEERHFDTARSVAVVAGRALDPDEPFGLDLDYVWTSPVTHAFTPNHRGREIIYRLHRAPITLQAA